MISSYHKLKKKIWYYSIYKISKYKIIKRISKIVLIIIRNNYFDYFSNNLYLYISIYSIKSIMKYKFQNDIKYNDKDISIIRMNSI